jgi:hypothetical protein
VSAATTTPCTWAPDCPGQGTHRMERRGGVVSLVEFVCAAHVEAAEASGYILTTTTPRPLA